MIIDENVKVTVQNWTTVANAAMSSTVWYLRNLSSQSSATLTGSSGAATLGSTNLIGGAPLNQIGFRNEQGQTTWVADTNTGWFDHEIRPSPEPGTYGAFLISTCVGVVGWRAYRRRKTLPR